MDIRKLAVEETAFVHLHDASDELLYEPSADGTPDQTGPLASRCTDPAPGSMRAGRN